MSTKSDEQFLIDEQLRDELHCDVAHIEVIAVALEMGADDVFKDSTMQALYREALNRSCVLFARRIMTKLDELPPISGAQSAKAA